MKELIPLFGEVNDLKRLSGAGSSYSFAEELFLGAWTGLVSGVPVAEIAVRTAAEALCSVRLGGITRHSLLLAGLSNAQISRIFVRSLGEVAGPLDVQLRMRMEESLSYAPLASDECPRFAQALCKQPRAGATRPKHPRITLSPTESHGDHCGIVAIYAVLLASRFEASIERPFVAALAHHLHNAVLPDGGFTGEELLGEHLNVVVSTLRAEALVELPHAVAELVSEALVLPDGTNHPESKTFHAADVLDRVLQMKWYQQAATFRLSMALEDMDLVHPGPTQSLQLDVLRSTGLL